jgi:large subunit ribosomal protein L28
MAKCAHCGKTTTFGHNVSFSNRATNRQFRPNLQKVTVIENGRRVQKTLCTKCIRTLAKTA